jgi:hypothetical protein
MNYGKMNYGFIITRHVKSYKTNNYWNLCVRCIRRFYPNRKIVIIDDNSDKQFVKPFENYSNVTIIESEYPKRGELLPFVYLLKHHYFDNAVIIHDSVFFHKKLNFHKIKLPVIPLWHFDRNIDQPQNKENNLRIAVHLKNNNRIMNNLKSILKNDINYVLPWRKEDDWNGCFGVQCFINYYFLKNLQNKYEITNLIHHVGNRTDRCSLERIMGVIFNIECPASMIYKSLLGNIFSYMKFGYSFEEYKESLKEKKPIKPIVKVWTGR